MIKRSAILGLLVVALAGTIWAQDSDDLQGVPHLDHVFRSHFRLS